MQRYDIFYTLQTFLAFIFEKNVPCSHTYMKKCKYKGVDSLTLCGDKSTNKS